MDLAAEGEAVVCVSLCQAAETLVGLGSLKVVVVVVVVVVEVVVVEVVVEVVRVEPIRMEPRFVGTHSTCAIHQG